MRNAKIGRPEIPSDAILRLLRLWLTLGILLVAVLKINKAVCLTHNEKLKRRLHLLAVPPIVVAIGEFVSIYLSIYRHHFYTSSSSNRRGVHTPIRPRSHS